MAPHATATPDVPYADVVDRDDKEDRRPNEAFAALDESYERLPIQAVRPSKTNPRKHFDVARMAQLTASIKDKGVLTPIVVREMQPGHGGADRFEIVAGECRHRAAKAAGLTHIPAVVRNYTDAQVLEVQLEENIHRNDLTPLEEAHGYRALIDANPDKHSAGSIATRIGMSVDYVWDRLRLLHLVADAKQLLERGLISVGHAVILSRLKADDQARAIAYDPDVRSRPTGLWREDAGLAYSDDSMDDRRKKKNASIEDRFAGLKPCSLRELQKWVDNHVRFDVAHAAAAQPLTFEPLQEQVAALQAEKTPRTRSKVIAISFDSYLQPEAKTDDERTYGPSSFKFADGQKHEVGYNGKTAIAPTCEHKVLGVVAAGELRGQSFDVCIARDKCNVHWKKEIADRARAQKQRESGATAKASAKQSAADKKRAAEEAKRRAAEERWAKVGPALKKACAERIRTIKTVTPAMLAAALKSLRLPATKPSDLPRMLVNQANSGEYFSFYGRDHGLAWAKAIGVDVDAVSEKAAPSAEAKK